jgi:arylsulfatase A-like enzyme
MVGTLISLHTETAASAEVGERPNFVLILVDDMGYGDLGCYGSAKNHTPNVDRLAAEGMQFTDFYVASSVCSPSRAAILTGCYPQRVNLHMDEESRCVLFPGSRTGLNPSEKTIADVLKTKGYSTACIGKWHLGDHPDFLPARQGFDYYFGIPYSNDMGSDEIPLPLMRNERVIEAPANQDELTQRYTQEAMNFIRNNKDNPFFLYLAHSMVHLPLHASAQFVGKSNNGIYGDAVEEVDWSTGEIMKTLTECGIDDNTLVIFTSDNGSTGRYGGNNAPLRGHKGQTDDGGMRVPCVMRYPSKIPAGRLCREVACSIDFFPTIVSLAGAIIDPGMIDGSNIWPLMSGMMNARSPHDIFAYYQMDQLQCLRSGKWKLHIPLEVKKRNWGKPEENVPLCLYDLSVDIHEDNDLSAQYPEIVNQILKKADALRINLGDLNRNGQEQRPAGWVAAPYHQILVD